MNYKKGAQLFLTISLSVLSLLFLVSLMNWGQPAQAAPKDSYEQKTAAVAAPVAIPVPPDEGVTFGRPFQLPVDNGAPTVITVCASCPYQSVQAAVDAIAVGGLIKVAQGTFTSLNSPVVMIAKPLTLQGGYTSAFTEPPDPAAHPTILDGQDARQVIYINNVTVTLKGFHIYRGNAAQGGGVYISGGNSTLSQNRIYGNTADTSGGGLYIADGATFVQNNLVYMNQAIRGGGAYVAGGASIFQHNTFYANQVDDQGGGVYIAAGSSVMTATLVASNTAAFAVGGIYAPGSVKLGYNDVWGNIGGDYIGPPPGTDINADPLFASVNPAAPDFLSLQAGSPCVDWVPAAQSVPADFNGLVRPFGLAADIGAYELYSGACFARVDDGAVYGSVQAAVDAATSGSVVRVAGICQGVSSRPIGYTQTVYISRPITLQGGYTVADWENPNWAVNETVLDAQQLGRVVYIANIAGSVLVEGFHIRNGRAAQGGGLYIAGGNPTLWHNKIYNNSAAEPGLGIEGGGLYIYAGNSTIQNNQIYSNTAKSANYGSGGGLYIRDGNSLIQNNAISTNTAQSSGGGVFIGFTGMSPAPTLENNQIFGNQTVGVDNHAYGAGIYARNGSPKIRGNNIYANSVIGCPSGVECGGGGIYLYTVGLDSVSVVERNAIHHNYGGSRGGGIYNQGTEPGYNVLTIQNNLIYNNSVTQYGAGIIIWTGGSAVLSNNTIFGNTGGSGIHNGNHGSYIIRNNIIANNDGIGISLGGTGHIIAYNDIWNNGGGTCTQMGGPCDLTAGNILSNPLFINTTLPDLRLQSASPAIDTADPGNYPLEDYARYTRPFGARADMGAFEYYAGTCFAQVAPATRVYNTVQAAVDAAATGGWVKVAGTCNGTLPRTVGSQTFHQTAYISKALTLRGGYTLTNWTAPTTIATLNAQSTGRGVYITGTGVAVIDGFVVRGGAAGVAGGGNNGGGIFLAKALTPVIQNVVFNSNTAANGGGFAAVGGNPRLYNNTFVANAATSTGGGLYLAAGSPVVSNTIIASNTAVSWGGLYAGGSAVLDYNVRWNNTANVSWGTHSKLANPGFVNFAGGDFHLAGGSPCVNAGDPNTKLTMDWEGNSRPLPLASAWYDIGADEGAIYPGVSFERSEQGSGFPGLSIVYNHRLTNTGSVSDTFGLSHSLVAAEPGWSASYPASIMLGPGEAIAVPVAVQVPADVISGAFSVLNITATSGLNAAVYATVTDLTIVKRAWGLELYPEYNEHVNPGAVITFPHTLRNTGNFTDTFQLTLGSARGWSTLTPTQLIVLGVYQTATVWVRVEVPATTPGGLIETAIVTAIRSGGGGETLRATVTDIIEVNYQPGDRYVAITGNDTLNNCQVVGSPCKTIVHAADQAATGDTIKVAAGVYNGYDIVLNKNITLTGGYNSQFQIFDPVEYETIIDAQGAGRVLYILGGPIIEGFTLQGGWTAGSGGGIYISQGSPTIRKNIIRNNTAGSYGGGIYNSGLGAPLLEQNVLAGNTAQQGGGFSSSSGAPRFWSNILNDNSAGIAGGGIYASGGSPLIWHATIYHNVANRGGGIYLAGGAPTISNTLVVSNSAVITGGGIYLASGGPSVDYNNVWANAAGDYVGLSAGLHSMSVDPMLVITPTAANFLHLRLGSPCIDVGDATIAAEDVDGQPRVADGVPDIGADEFWRGGVMLEPNRTGTGYQGTALNYEHVLTNTGNAVDTFYLTWHNQHGWAVTVDGVTDQPAEVTLGISESQIIGVQIVQIPTATVTGTVDVTVITATSKSDTSIFDTAVDITTVRARWVGVELEPDTTKEGQPEDILWYYLTLTNTGNHTDTFDIIRSSDWLHLIQPASREVTLGPGVRTTVIVTAMVPYLRCWEQYAATLMARSQFSVERGDNPPVSDSATLTATVLPIEGVELLGSTQRVVSNIGNQLVVHHLNWLWNANNCFTDTFNLSIPASSPFPAQLVSPSPVTLAPIGYTFVEVDVFVPPSVPACTNLIIGLTTLTAVGSYGSGTTRDETIVNQCLDVDLSPDHITTITQPYIGPVTVPYVHTLTNNGNYTDTIELSAFDNLGWVKTINGIPYPPPPTQPIRVTLGSGESAPVNVTVLMPDNAYTTTDRLIVEADSILAGDFVPPIWRTDTATDTTVVRRPAVVLAPNYSQTVAPGMVFTFVHVLKNVGGVVDSYDLTATNTRPEWTIGVNPPLVSNVSPGLTSTVIVAVGVPAGTVSSTVNVATITATSRIAAVVFGQATDEMLVPYVPSAVIAPDHVGMAFPNTMITYTHVLTNTGNYTDTFDLTTHSTFGYSELRSDPIVQLGPGQAFTEVVVTVFLPDHAAPGEVEVTEVLVTFADKQATANNFTVISPTAGTRYVAVGGTDDNNNCLIPDGLGPCATVQHAVNYAVPGDEVRVAQGTFNDLYSVNGLTQVVYLSKTLVLQGGYTVGNWDTADPLKHPTVLDAGGQGRVVYIDGGGSPIMPTLGGFHLRSGYANSGEGGAGLYVAAGVAPVVQQNIIYDNAAQDNRSGGGVYWGSGGGVLSGNTMHNNDARYGGGVFVAGGSPQMWNNVFYSNQATIGGGLYNVSGSPAIFNNTFYNNTATGNGGGIYNSSGSPVISNTIVVSNTSPVNYTGGIYSAGGSPSLAYNNVWNNPGGDYGGNASAGPGSLSINPRFVSESLPDLRINGASPCIDVGDPNTTVDIDRYAAPRPLQAGYDIGAFEYALTRAKRGVTSAGPSIDLAYTIVVTNSSRADWSNIAITDTLHEWLEYAGTLASSAGSGEYIASTRTISWTGPVYANAPSLITFTARITDWLAPGLYVTNVATADYVNTNVITTVVIAVPGPRHVSQMPNSTNALNNCLANWKPCRTIQYAVGQALDGDTVRVAAATYTDTLSAGQVVSVTSKTVTLAGGYNATVIPWTRNPELYQTYLVGGGSPGVRVIGPADVTVAGFYLTNSTSGVVATNDAEVQVYQSHIYGNSGDGVHATGSRLAVKRAWVHDNSGDGVEVDGGTYYVVNNVFAHNTGAGLRANGTGNLVHNTFARNDGVGAVINGNAAFTNTIFYSETVGLDAAAGVSQLWNTIWYNSTATGGGTVITHTDIYSDPLFYDPDSLDYHISINSPALDAGLDMHVTEDIDGGRRPLLYAPDIGADEFPLEVTKLAPDSADPGQVITYVIVMQGAEAPYLVITDTLHAHLDYAGWLTYTRGSGQYHPASRTITWGGPVSTTLPTYITFTARITGWLASGAQVINYATGKWQNNFLRTAPVATTINAVPGARHVAQTTGVDTINNCLLSWKPCQTIQYAVNQTLSGDLVRVAMATYTDTLSAGQVVSVTGKTVTLQGGYQAGTWAHSPSLYPTFLDSGGSGVGVRVTGPATVTVSGLRIANSAIGVDATDADVDLSQTFVYGSSGDGVRVMNGAYHVVNSVLAHNAGAGLRASGAGTLTHNTFARNAAGGAVITGTAAFINTIFYDHAAGITALGGASITADHTLWHLTPAYPGSTNNVAGDPKFVDPNAVNYHIKGDSAAVNAGLWVDVTEDVDGDLRPVGMADIGADQYPLRLSRGVAPEAAAPCEVVTHTLTLTNLSEAAFSGVALRDALDDRSSFGGYVWASAGTASYNSARNAIEWTGPVNVGAPSYIIYTARFNPYLSNGTLLTYTARITDSISAFNTLPLTATVATLPALLSKSTSAATMTIGQVVNYTILYTAPPGHRLYQPSVVDTLPRVYAGGVLPDPALVYVTGSANPPNPSVSPDGSVLTWGSLPTLAPGCSSPQSAAVIFSARVLNVPGNTAGDPLTNTVSLSYHEMDASGMMRVVPTTHRAALVEPAIHLSKNMAPNTNLGANDLVLVTVNLNNSGGSALYDAVLTDTLPSQLSFVSATPGYSLNGQSVIWPVNSIAPGIRPFTITARVGTTVDANTTIVNNAWAFGTSQPGTVSDDRSYTGSAQASATTGYPDLTISKSGPAARAPGQTVTYTIQYGNVGAVRATGVRVTDTLPALANVTYASSVPAIVTRVGQNIIWVLNSPVNRSATGFIWITGTIPLATPQGTILTNTARIGAASPEPNRANNVAVAVTGVGVPEIQTTPLSFYVTIAPNSTAARTLSIANLGAGPLTWGSLAESPAAAWLSEAPLSGDVPVGGAADQVTLTFSSVGMPNSTYNTTLSIPNNDPDENPVNINVTMVVTTTCTPVSGVSFVFAPNSPLVGQTVAFTGTAAQGSEPISYSWTFGDGQSGIGQNVQHSYGAPGNRTVTLTAANACSSAPSQQVITVQGYRIYLPIVFKNF